MKFVFVARSARVRFGEFRAHYYLRRLNAATY
jgi:hypothetical protein